MAQISTPAVPQKMYRHFAVVTVLFTAVLAVFSDGENREAVASELAARHDAEAARLRAQQPAYGQAQLKQAPGVASGYRRTDYADVSADFGEPMDVAGAREQQVGRNGFTVAPEDTDFGAAENPTTGSGLTEAQRQAALQKKRQQQKQAQTAEEQAKERQQAMDALLKQSIAGGLPGMKPPTPQPTAK